MVGVAAALPNSKPLGFGGWLTRPPVIVGSWRDYPNWESGPWPDGEEMPRDGAMVCDGRDGRDGRADDR
jgi:hypothetical protein